MESAPDHPLLPVTPDRMGAAFADIHLTHSWESFAAAAIGKLEAFLETATGDGCTSSRAIPYRARFGCSSSSMHPGRRSCSSGRTCRTGWLSCSLDWSTLKRASPCKPSRVSRDSGAPLGKAIWLKLSGNHRGRKRVAFPVPTAWRSGSSSMRTWSIGRHGHGASPC